MSIKTVTIGGMEFVYDEDYHAGLMSGGTVESLRDHVRDNWPGGNLPPFGLSKLRKADLAAIVAAWVRRDKAAEARQDLDLALRQAELTPADVVIAEWQTYTDHVSVVPDFDEKATAPIEPLTQDWPKYSCGCGQMIQVLENGTFKRHTRHNIAATASEIRAGVAPQRIRCRWTGKFPQSVADMRDFTNLRDQSNQRPLTYRTPQTDTDHKAFRMGVRSGSRRARRVGTKNAHRANYGKRYQTA